MKHTVRIVVERVKSLPSYQSNVMPSKVLWMVSSFQFVLLLRKVIGRNFSENIMTFSQ